MRRWLAVLLLLALPSCAALTGLGISMGLIHEPEPGVAARAGAAVDRALGDWFWTLLFGGSVAASQAHGPTRRATVRVVKATGRVILRKPPPNKPPTPDSPGR